MATSASSASGHMHRSESERTRGRHSEGVWHTNMVEHPLHHGLDGRERLQRRLDHGTQKRMLHTRQLATLSNLQEENLYKYFFKLEEPAVSPR